MIALILAAIASLPTATARAGTTTVLDPAQTTPAWKRVESAPSLAWPRDHGSHPAYETEWWYATGDLTDGAGRRFGYQITIFRRGLDARAPTEGESHLRPRQVFAANAAIVDVAGELRTQAERVRRGAAGLAGADENDLHAWVEDWRIDRAEDGTIRVHAIDIQQRLALDLELEPEKPLVLHGRGGLSQKGAQPGNASVYTSWPRMRTRGTLQFGRTEKPLGPSFVVTGESWFDHEYGSSQLGPNVAGWDWFGLRLADGRDLMLYRLRALDGAGAPWSAGTLVERDGSARALRAEEFRLEALYPWKSTLTRASYPIAWKLSVPSAGIACEVRARVAACEFDARASLGLIYWEGPVGATGSVEGSGYLELTGYAAPLAGRF